MDQADAQGGGLVEDRPQLGAALAEVDRLFAPVAVVVARSALTHALHGVQLSGKRGVVGPYLVAQAPVELVPGQRAVDPAAAHARPHQPRHQSVRIAARSPVRAQSKLDRQRAALLERRRLRDQRTQRLLPDRSQRIRNRPRPARRHRHRRSPRGRGDHERGHVLAVVTDRAGALAVLELERLVVATGEGRGRLVAPSVAGHRACQRPVLWVPLGHRDAPAADEGATARANERGPTAASISDRSTTSTSLATLPTVATVASGADVPHHVGRLRSNPPDP